MKVYRLKDMIGGWFVGNFLPTSLKTADCEVAFKKYKRGDSEERHFHKIATEITLIAKGKVKMNDIIYGEGDIVVMEAGESTDFHALEDTTNVVVKVPSLIGDKYLGKPIQ